MESAIPKHLRGIRSCPRRASADYVPGFPSTVARFSPSIRRVVMAYVGIQHRQTAPSNAASTFQQVERSMSAKDGPGYWERAAYTDETGYRNILCIAYWDDTARFDRWFARRGVELAHRVFTDPGVGTFIEVLRPSVERFETLFSADHPEGIASLSEGFSGAVQEHGYWGGARDRMPQSQTDALVA